MCARPCSKDASKMAATFICAAWSGKDAKMKNSQIRLCPRMARRHDRDPSDTCGARACAGYGIQGLAHTGVES